ALDSTKLDGDNRFSFLLDSIEDGLYHFNHEPEFQNIYLEKGDSIQLRLNTMDFDESLVFSGTNEAVNNFLLELFLVNEEEEQNMYRTFYDLEPEGFKDKIAALKKEKLEALSSLKFETGFSEGAFGIAKACIDYTYYKYLELYPFEHKRKLRESVLHDLPNDFYSYRKNVNYDNGRLNYLKPYYEFMKSHFGNISYMTCAQKCGIKGEVISNQLHFNEHKLHLIDSLVKGKELRDNLFRNVAFNYLLKEHNAPENNEVFIKQFEKVSGNNVHIKEIESLYNGIRRIQPNNKIPDIKVVSVDGRNISLQDIGKDRKVIFYFWSSTNKKHYENIFKRVADLNKEKSNIDFVGINVKTDQNNWNGIIQNLNLDPTKQYRAENFKELTETLIIIPMNKCIITENALIVDAFSNIYDKL
ncbi:MAG: transaldolase, partial [Maribacter sp.]